MSIQKAQDFLWFSFLLVFFAFAIYGLFLVAYPDTVRPSAATSEPDTTELDTTFKILNTDISPNL